MNILPATSNGKGTISIAGDKSQLATAEFNFKGDALFGIRPEEIEVVGENDGVLASPVSATAIERTGSDTYITAQIGDHSFTIREAARKHVNVGDKFNIAFDNDAVSLFDKDSGGRIN